MQSDGKIRRTRQLIINNRKNQANHSSDKQQKKIEKQEKNFKSSLYVFTEFKTTR
jgi:hypothetical protein